MCQQLPAVSNKGKTKNGLLFLVSSDFRRQILVDKWFSTRSGFVTYRAYGHMWRHFCLPQAGCYCHLEDSVRGMLLNRNSQYSPLPHNKELSSSNVNIG